jgi:hypothetical protein
VTVAVTGEDERAVREFDDADNTMPPVEVRRSPRGLIAHRFVIPEGFPAPPPNRAKLWLVMAWRAGAGLTMWLVGDDVVADWEVIDKPGS